MQFLTEQMMIIKAACKKYDNTAAFEAVDRLKEAKWSRETAAVINEIHDTLMLQSDFEKAAEIACHFMKIHL